jgi:phosphoserine aminotransferase
MARALNFSAGPAVLPLVALEQAQRELLDFAGTGMSVMEQSHRDKPYERVHMEAMALLREIASIPDTHEILFLQGGASQAFATIPMNFLQKGDAADYVVTGAWGEKAVSEAKAASSITQAETRELVSTREADGGYRRVPESIPASKGTRYVHLTSNETIHGVQFAATPGSALPTDLGAPVVIDMSSDFLWKPVDWSKIALAYAGAQKNLGPSGIILVVIDKAFMAEGRKDLPKIFQFRTFADNQSLYNTPPTFAIYLVHGVLGWLKAQGGVVGIEKENRKKADALYAALDRHPEVYEVPVDLSSRSTMNVVFRFRDTAREPAFLAEAKKRNMSGLKGHRSVGGMRASLYNAVPYAWVSELAALVDEFAQG